MPRRTLPRAVLRQRRGLDRLPAALPLDAPAQRKKYSTSNRPPRWQDRVSRRAREQQLQREPICRVCRAESKTVEAVEVDHIVPRSEGGSMTDPANLRSLCWEHARDKDVEDRARRTGRPVRRRRRVKIDPVTGYPLEGGDHWWSEPLPKKAK